MTQSGNKNPNWRGGRSITSHGYVLIRVGKDHHLSDARGYTYEHRIIAEGALGRRLTSGELVHHINGDKADNHPDNLQVVSGNAEHYIHHRKRQDLRLPGEQNQSVKCGCGCEREFLKFDTSGRPRKYISGHNPQPAPTLTQVLSILEGGPMHRSEIIKLCNKTRSSIGVAIHRLKKQGKIKRVARAEWALVSHPVNFKERENLLVKCACGCGAEFPRFDKHWRSRKFVSGHNARKEKNE